MPSATTSAAHPGRQHRLVGAGRRRRPPPRAVAVGSVIACGVRITSTASTFLSFSTISHGLGEAVGRGVAQHVDRVAVRPAGRQELVELARIVSSRELGQLAVAGDQGVGGHHARAAGVGDDRQPVALGRAAAGPAARRSRTCPRSGRCARCPPAGTPLRRRRRRRPWRRCARRPPGPIRRTGPPCRPRSAWCARTPGPPT